MDINYKTVNEILTVFLITIDNRELQKIISYSFDGGKRLRPMIIYELCKKLNIPKSIYSKLIICVELIHSASLILDDMPFMDNDIYRRNKLCVYKVFGEVKAKQASNYMFILAYKILSNIKYDNRIIINILNFITLQNSKIVNGQMYDLKLSNKKKVNLETLNLKTYPLFVISFCMPYLFINHNQINSIKKMAKYFSIMFQIMDDYEDFEDDLKKPEINNHIKKYGKIKTIFMYNKYRNKFINKLKKNDIYSDFFKNLINKIDNKFLENGGQLY